MIVSAVRSRIIRWTKSGSRSEVIRTLVYRGYSCSAGFISNFIPYFKIAILQSIFPDTEREGRNPMTPMATADETMNEAQLGRPGP